MQVTSDQFKREVTPHLRLCLEANGGAASLAKRAEEIPSTLSFIAGWTCGALQAQRERRWQVVGYLAGEPTPTLSVEEIRRIHDMTRMALAGEIL